MAISPNSSSGSPATETANSDRWAVSLVMGAALVFLALVVVIGGPAWMLRGLETSATTKAALEAQGRLALIGALLAGVFAWCGVQLSLNFKAMSRVLEQSVATQAASERSAYFAAQAGETARYAHAMALLGHETLEVRLGGIYALERLARESKQDHGPVMEVLAAFVRTRAHWGEGDIAPARPSADVQAVLSVLGRRVVEFDPDQGHVDLHGTAMARAYLPFSNFASAFLYETNLEGAILQNTDMRGAWLWKARLAGAVLDGANLEGADLTGVSGLTLDQLKTAHLDATTKLPEYMRTHFDWSQPGEAASKPIASTHTPSADELKLPSLRHAT
ncbi:pentapeptide repeat-containing protein [bacterium]|nr:MAG: pentapeptide repeat-containing protein [bacterium]